jgi:hypothetical protein
MPEDNQQAVQSNQAPVQAENKAPAVPTEISALAAYRAKKEAAGSPPTQKQGESDGQPQPNVGQDNSQRPQREPFIPRERFDEVAQQRDYYRTQLDQFQQQVQAMPQQQVGPTGMVQPAQVPQQQQAQVQSFIDQVTKDPEAKKNWQKRIANEGVPALLEFVTQTVQAVGKPLLDEYSRAVNDRLSPIQRQFVNQQINSYVSQRQSDPSFVSARPVFDRLVQTAVQRGYDVTNPQVLGTIEFLAKQQGGQQYGQQAPQMPQVTPFTERPGAGNQGFPKPAQRALTPQEQGMARRFNMTDQQYIDSLRAMGVEQ